MNSHSRVTDVLRAGDDPLPVDRQADELGGTDDVVDGTDIDNAY